MFYFKIRNKTVNDRYIKHFPKFVLVVSRQSPWDTRALAFREWQTFGV